MLLREKLRELRERAGLTQDGLAAAAGLSLGSVRNYEQGIRIPTFPAVVKLGRALGVTCEVFANCSDVTTPTSQSPSARSH